MGRLSLLDKLSITLEDLVNEYEKVGTMEAVARGYSCSERTVRRYLDKAKVTRKRGPNSSTDLGATYDRGCLGRWIREHRRTELPHSVRQISALSGCTKDEVKCYLYRKRRELRRLLSKLPRLDEVNIILPTTAGYKVPTRAFQAYKLYLNRWTFLVKIVAWLKPRGKKVTIEVSASVLRNRLRLRPSPQGTPAGKENPSP